jgi:hypothetical protein
MDALTTLLQDFANIPQSIAAATTYCGQLQAEVLKEETPQFKRTGLHYVANGMVAEYLCKIDGRTYEVTITPVKLPKEY